MYHDIDGFYHNGELLNEVKKITNDIIQSAGSNKDIFSTGGMQSKLAAVKICINAGISVIIANAGKKNILNSNLYQIMKKEY